MGSNYDANARVINALLDKQSKRVLAATSSEAEVKAAEPAAKRRKGTLLVE